MSIELDNFADFEIGNEIHKLADGLARLEINAGQIPLSKLLDKEISVKAGRTLETAREGVLNIHLPPTKEDGDSQG